MIRHGYTTLALVAAFALSACATGGEQSDAEALALHRAHAGQPVDSFSYFGSINGWNPLGDRALVVWTRPSEAWLLELSGPCRDLEFTPSIGLTGNMNRVHARFDKVLVNSRDGMSFPCQIQQIQPLDVKALRASQKQLREASVHQRAADAQGD